MAVAEKAALTGLQCSLDTLLAEVERLLIAEQQVTDYKQLDESISPEPTTACKRVVAFLTRMFEVAHGALDGLNRVGFMTQLGFGLYNSLIQHWKRFTFDPRLRRALYHRSQIVEHACKRLWNVIETTKLAIFFMWKCCLSGGLRLKRDVLEYADCVRRFKIPTVDEKFSLLGTMVNVFIVAPESLPTLVDGTLRDVRDEVLRLIELRDDYKKAKVGNIVNSMNG
ncbi:hypothetical protein M758_12G040600 [Ceratodon purpureus]|nr:hypothetical protein M758_12G040600 [Ceratodon purpureus]